MPLGVFELAGLAAALAWIWWSLVGMTSQDRKTIKAHYARRQEQLVGLRRAGLDHRFNGLVRIFEVEVKSADGRTSVRRIGIDFLGQSGQKLWRYDAQGCRHPIF